MVPGVGPGFYYSPDKTIFGKIRKIDFLAYSNANYNIIVNNRVLSDGGIAQW